MKQEDNIIESIKDEINDDYSDDSLFNISSWGADLTFRELISMYEENELVKPELQRKYVWDKSEASRFIESILLGLPVPSIFLAQSGSQKLIVDGYQRIMTVYDYVRGVFSTDNKVFKLSNSEKINKLWRNKAFAELMAYEDRLKGKLPEDVCIGFIEKYSAEEKTLNAEMVELEQRIAKANQTEVNADEFLSKIKHYVEAPELTREMCYELIDKIVIGGHPKVTGTERVIDIVYKVDINSIR